MGMAMEPETRESVMGDEREAETRRALRKGPGSNGGNGGRKMEQGAKGDGDGLANFLGWFSIGLGLAQIAAPHRVARFIGIDDTDRSRRVMRAVGMREIAAGVGILSQPNQPGWLWSRVAGDVMDLALLGNALGSSSTEKARTRSATAAVLGVAALDMFAGRKVARAAEAGDGVQTGGIHVKRAITVGLPVEDVYRFWHNFENLPRFMRHLESVSVIDARRSHWKAKGPAGMTVEWDAEMVEDRPNELIAWRSVQDADVDNEGSVQFRRAPGGRGTEISVDLRYDPPGGKLTAALAKLFHEEPGIQVQDDLHRFKQVLEVGEVVLSDASVHQRPHPARPSEKIPESAQATS